MSGLGVPGDLDPCRPVALANFFGLRAISRSPIQPNKSGPSSGSAASHHHAAKHTGLKVQLKPSIAKMV